MSRFLDLDSQATRLLAWRARHRLLDIDLGPWRWVWVGVLTWAAGIYLLINYRLPDVLPASLDVYLARPLAWLSLALLAYLGWRFGLAERPAVTGSLIQMAILSGAFQVAVFLGGGLFMGFGRSPYARQLPAIIGNLLYAGSTLVGIEMSRAYLVSVFSRRNPMFGLLLSAIVFSFVSLPSARIHLTGDVAVLIRSSGETYLPMLSENLMASFLALLGGPLASIGYRGVLEGFEWLSPILPRLPWMVTAFLGVLAPMVGMLVVRTQILADSGSAAQARQGDTTTAWVMVGVVATTLLWFNIGFFGVRPTLVSGVSMNPALMAGDIVVTRDVAPDSIQVGDIVRYRRGGIYILHRVVSIEDRRDGRWLVTRGDANNVDDPPIPAAQVEGKLVLTAPKIGWIAIGVRALMGWLGWGAA